MRSGGSRGFAWDGVTAWAERALEEHGTFEAWAAAAPDARPLTGRGTVRAVEAPAPGPDRSTAWVVRHYLRGGAVAALLHDTYPRSSRPRPLRELHAAVAARARGVPTPAVVAGAVYPAGPLFYRADLVTELVPDARDLAGVLFDPPGDATEMAGDHLVDRRAALRATGALVALAAGAGVRHLDLNAKNVVLRVSQTGELEPYMIDLDRCRIRTARRPAADARAMAGRLERSLRKLGEGCARPLDSGDWSALREGWAAPPPVDGGGTR